MFGDRRVLVDRERELLGKIRMKIHEELDNIARELKTSDCSQDEVENYKEYEKELNEGLQTTSYEELAAFSYADSIIKDELEELKQIDIGKKNNTSKNKV